MNKQEFLEQLRRNLKGLSEEDIKEVLFDYEEHFEIGFDKGRSEEEIAVSLGDPKILARQIKTTYMIQIAERKSNAGNVFKAVMASIGLGFFNMIFLIPLIALMVAVFALVISGGAVVIAGILAFIASLLSPFIHFENINVGTSPSIGMFLSIGVTCLGGLITIGSSYLLKAFYKFLINYLKLNLKVITGKER
ncbi:HAAS signaling domain-containing protein [Abyssisolibacter fermentans]|uniref:HAAS signaling domain-containing protein n=1 Tax=Abyssisolibacter fermentans TaxID=1766203 RepID=UPI0008333CB5|nr:DUF1700 domain-containing protein [Abyssisolibacter fermentans]